MTNDTDNAPDDLAAIDTITQIVTDRTNHDIPTTYIPSGALAIAAFSSEDGRMSGFRFSTLGSLNVYALEGVLRSMIRAIEAGEFVADRPD